MSLYLNISYIRIVQTEFGMFKANKMVHSLLYICIKNVQKKKKSNKQKPTNIPNKLTNEHHWTLPTFIRRLHLGDLILLRALILYACVLNVMFLYTLLK